MKGFGFLLLFRQVIVLYQTGYCLYRFRFGKCVEYRVSSQEIESKILASASDILVACPIQEIYLGQSLKLKYFDRASFLVHTLSHQFKSTQGIASRWLSSNRFMGVKFTKVSDQNFDKFQGRWGALLGELARFDIFKDSEGCLLAPTRFDQVYEIYIKNKTISFVRLVDHSLLITPFLRHAELDSLKRYFERYFQANPRTLSVKWWGPNAPEDIEVYQSSFLEESLVQNYIGYVNPVLPYKAKLSSQWFFDQRLLKKLTILIYTTAVVLLLLSFKNSIDIWSLKESYQELTLSVQDYRKKYQACEQKQQTPQEIKLFSEKKAVVEVLDRLKPLTARPLSELHKISSYVKDHIRCHEFIWLRGHIAIDPLDHTLTLHPMALNQETFSHQDQDISSQSLVLALTGPSVKALKNFEQRLQKEYVDSYKLKTWIKSSSLDSLLTLESDKKGVYSLLEMIKKP